MGSMSLMHWLVVLAIILVLFGAGKLPRVMGDFANRPTTGLLPQISQCLAICKTLIIPGRSRQDQSRRVRISRFSRLAVAASPTWEHVTWP